MKYNREMETLLLLVSLLIICTTSPSYSEKNKKYISRWCAEGANSLTLNHHVAMIRSLLTNVWKFLSVSLVAHSLTKPLPSQRRKGVESTSWRWGIVAKTLLSLMMALPQVAATDNCGAIDALMADMKNITKMDSVQGISFLSDEEQAIEKNTLCRKETRACVTTTTGVPC